MSHRVLRAVAPVVFVLLAGAAAFMLQRNVVAQAAKPTTAAKPTAKLVPHPQAILPPLTLPAYQMPRSPEVVRAAYKFAAEHPEVLTYMPCFCGCEKSGHRGNEDCFVKTRAKNGDVTAWNEHGMECSMCLAVAEQAMKMSSAGSSVKEIRAEVERKYGQLTEFRTSTPPPPAR